MDTGEKEIAFHVYGESLIKLFSIEGKIEGEVDLKFSFAFCFNLIIKESEGTRMGNLLMIFLSMFVQVALYSSVLETSYFKGIFNAVSSSHE